MCCLDGLAFAGIAQPVEQLIRNQQVACSSHVSSSKFNPWEMAKVSRFPGIFTFLNQSELYVVSLFVSF